MKISDLIFLSGKGSKHKVLNIAIHKKHRVVIAQDVTDKGAKRFSTLKNEDELRDMIKDENNHLYEVLTENTPVKPHFDIEFDKSQLNPDIVINALVEIVSRTMIKLYGDDGMFDPEDLYVSGSDAKSTIKNISLLKSSRHLVINTPCVFENNIAFGAFVNIVLNQIMNPITDDDKELSDNLTYVINDQREPVIDMSIYTKNRDFKLINQSKMKDGDKRIQKPLNNNGNKKGHFVGYYGDLDDVDFYDISKLPVLKNDIIIDKKKLAPNRNKPHLNKDKHIPNIYELLVTGKTIQLIEPSTKIDYLLKSIPNNPTQKQPYKVWFAILCALKHNGLFEKRDVNKYLDIFITWTEKAYGENFDLEKTIDIWNTITPRENGYNFFTLWKLAGMCNEYIKNINPVKFLFDYNHNFKRILYNKKRCLNVHIPIWKMYKTIDPKSINTLLSTESYDSDTGILIIVENESIKNKLLENISGFYSLSNEPAFTLESVKTSGRRLIITYDESKIFDNSYIDVIYSTSKYTDTNVDKTKTLILEAPMKCGKSYQIRRFLRNLSSGTSIIALAPRIKFGKEIHTLLKEHGFVFYQDIENPKEYKKHNRIVIQMESLHHIKGNRYDVLLGDEITSNLYQMSSQYTQGENLNENLKTFEKIYKESNYKILADAFIDRRTINIVKALDRAEQNLFDSYDHVTHITNTVQPEAKKAVIMNKDNLIYKQIPDLLKERKKIVFHTSSFNQGYKLLYALQKNGLLKEIKWKFYYSTNDVFHNRNMENIINKTDYNIGKNEDFNDVDTCWSELDLLIYTSTITIGISFDVKNHFDNLCIFGSCKIPIIRDVFQASLRVRDFKDNTVYIAIYDDVFGLNRDDTNIYPYLRHILDEKIKNNDKVKDKLGIVYDNNWGTYPPWYYELHLLNKLEYNTGLNNTYEQLFHKYLEINNYTVISMHDDEDDEQEIVTPGFLDDNYKNCFINYNSIDTTNVSKDEIDKKKKDGATLSFTEFWQDKKMIFDDKIQLDTDTDMKIYLFSLFHGSDMRRYKFFWNLYREKNISADLLMENDIKNNVYSFNAKLLAEKLDVIRSICFLLNIQNTTVCHYFTLKDLSKHINYIINQKNDWFKIFNIKYDEPLKVPKNEAIRILNKILARWINFSGKAIVKDTLRTKRTRNKSDRAVNEIYRISIGNQMIDYYEDATDKKTIEMIKKLKIENPNDQIFSTTKREYDIELEKNVRIDSIYKHIDLYNYIIYNGCDDNKFDDSVSYFDNKSKSTHTIETFFDIEDISKQNPISIWFNNTVNIVDDNKQFITADELYRTYKKDMTENKQPFVTPNKFRSFIGYHMHLEKDRIYVDKKRTRCYKNIEFKIFKPKPEINTYYKTVEIKEDISSDDDDEIANEIIDNYKIDKSKELSLQ